MQAHNFKQHSKARKNKLVDFPPIPDKLYFTIGEVGDLCLIEPYVIRFWEHEFSQLKPAKRRCNRRYYQKEQILLIRKIRNLLYIEGFTIEGARAKLACRDVSSESIDVLPLVLDAQTQMEDARAHENIEAKDLFGVEKTVEEKIVQIKDKTFLKEIAGQLEEIISVLEAEITPLRKL